MKGFFTLTSCLLSARARLLGVSVIRYANRESVSLLPLALRQFTLTHFVSAQSRLFSGACALMLCVLLGAAPAMAMVEVEDTRVDDVRVWYAADAAVPVVHVILTFEGAGSASDPAGLEGRAVLAANMLSEGAADMDARAFHTALETGAIQLYADADRDDVQVHIHALKAQLPEAMRLARLALTAPRFDDDALGVAKQEQRVAVLRQQESPSAVAQLAWAARMYGAHPYASSAVGDEESIARLSRDDLTVYRERYLTAANLSVVAAGDVDENALEDVLEPLVEALPQSFFPERDLAGVELRESGEVERIAFDAPQSTVVFGGKGLPRSDKRYYAAYLMNEALGGGGFNSRLMQDVRVKKGLVYGIGTGFAHADAVDVFAGQFATRNDAVDEAITTVKDTARRLATEGLSREECQSVKQDVINRFTLQLDSTKSIANVIAMMMRQDLGTDYLSERQALFEAVSCGDIQDAARSLLAPEAWHVVVVGGAANAAAAHPTKDAR